MTTDKTHLRNSSVRVEREYEGQVEDLWWLWTTREGFESWWGPEGFRVAVRELDLCVGGKLVYDMIAVDPAQIEWLRNANMPVSHGTTGRFTEIVPLRRLAITHMIDFIPGMRPYEQTIVAEFFPAGSSVSMVVTIQEHSEPEWTQRAVEGFESQLTRIPGALATRRKAKRRIGG